MTQQDDSSKQFSQSGRIETILGTGATAFPGVYDALSARIAEQVGFPMAFISGYSVAATSIGEPDFGLLTQTEMIEQARRVCRSVNIPILVDADTGYGNPLNVRRTVTELIYAGAAGCFLEDQVWPKKCGHMRGKKLIDRSEYLHKIQAAVDARQAANCEEFFIVARSDALAVAGMDEAIARVTAARELGASACFVEAPLSVDDLKEIGERTPGPLVGNMIEGGRTPVLSTEELEELGFSLILYPLSGLYGAAKILSEIYGKLKTEGNTRGEESRLMNFTEFNQLIGLDEKQQLAERYGAD